MTVLSQTRYLSLVRKELQQTMTKKQILEAIRKLPYNDKNQARLHYIEQKRRKAAIIYFTGTTIKISTIAKRFGLSATSIRFYLQNIVWSLRRENVIFFSFDLD